MVDHVEVSGLKIAYRRAGDGPPLVLLHGALGDHRDWRAQFDGLAGDFTLLAWDAPGHGRSDDPPETFGSQDFVDCLAAFLDALDVGPAHVLGLSWGSGLAIELFARRPDLVRTLVLASAYAGWAGSLPAAEVERRIERALREADLPAERFVPDWIGQLLTHRAPPELVDEVTEIMSGFHPVGYRALVRAFARTDLRPVLSRIDVPTLLLYGDEDVRAPLSVAEDLHARIPGSTLVVLPEVGHLSSAEAPERFNDAVRQFVRGARAASL